MKSILATTLSLLISTTLLGTETQFEHFYKVAKEECYDILSIRKEIDRINDQILHLLAERTAYVQRAGDIKSQKLKIANDSQRVLEQELKLLQTSDALGLPPEITLATFRALVEASIQFEQAYIDQK